MVNGTFKARTYATQVAQSLSVYNATEKDDHHPPKTFNGCATLVMATAKIYIRLIVRAKFGKVALKRPSF